MKLSEILDIPLDFLKDMFEGGWLYVFLGVLALVIVYLIWFAK